MNQTTYNKLSDLAKARVQLATLNQIFLEHPSAKNYLAVAEAMQSYQDLYNQQYA